ncbi:hypothetical protein EST38_g12032 [Candolleomyces aberdarensis]|uniref:Uncharacterized protein n=1 Tax=Candolleomyces aberdarensis TaxID=2316362 RepID=A0A4Q2D616_9AGAR|nr:hypothetical protein EST38_g12032 [Candolleomyces aberdarensis]
MGLFSVHLFSEPDKSNYSGVEDDAVDIGQLFRGQVFSYAIDQVLQLSEEQLAKVDQPVCAFLLVLSCSLDVSPTASIQSNMSSNNSEDEFCSSIPPGADTATLRSAAQYGLAKGSLVSTVIHEQEWGRLTFGFLG